MRELGGRDAPGGDLLLLAGCLLVALVAYALPRPWAADVAAGLRSTALRPVVALQARAARDRTARFQLEAIEAERDSLALLVMSDSAVRIENAELRALLAVHPSEGRHWAPAEVLHRPTPTDARTLTIDAGSEQGIQRFDPVVSAQGLLGYVWELEPRSAGVVTWLHPDWRASAVTGDGSVMGILAPTVVGSSGQSVLELRGVALRDSLPVGTLVFTSGLGGVYRRMLPVGRIMAESRDPLGYERRYLVAPFSNPAIVGHVMVLTSDSAGGPQR